MGLIQQLESIPAKLANSSGTLGSIVQQSTRAALALALPNDIEAYAITLQLITSSSQTSIKSFTFPVMPESLTMAQRYLMTVTTTLGGNYVDDFGRAPSPITLSGTFGKKIRASGVSGNLQGKGSIGQAVSILASAGEGLTTGYGMVKRLSDIVEQSHTVQSDGKIPTLVFYNWAFNSHWEVVVEGLDVKMDVQQNGLWFYQLSMKTLQPAQNLLINRIDGIVGSAVQNIVSGVLNKNVASLLTGVALSKVTSISGVSSALSKLGL